MPPTRNKIAREAYTLTKSTFGGTYQMKTEKLQKAFTSFKEKTVSLAKKAGAKNLIIICAVLVCGVAVMLNFILAGDGEKPASGGGTIDASELASKLEEGKDTEASADGDAALPKDDYFDSAVLNRDKARDEAIEVLSAVITSDSAIDEVKSQAEADIAAIAAAIELEANIEELVKAKGFEECVAVINGELANVIVKSEGLLPSEVAQITEIVYAQSGILPVNLTITEK